MTATTTDERPTTIKLWRTVGADEKLTLDLPPGYYEVVLVRTTQKPPVPHPSRLPVKPDRPASPAFPDCDDGFPTREGS